MGSDAEDDHHVKFTLKDDFESDHSNPVFQKGHANQIKCHLGFLQVKHRYRIELSIASSFLEEYVKDSKLVLKDDETAMPNIHCKLLSFKGKTSEQSLFYEAEIEFYAHKEKFLKEELKLVNSEGESVTFIFSARVLGRGKGTPSLKNGIHLLGIDQDDDESDASDWQGFSRTECDDI